MHAAAPAAHRTLVKVPMMNSSEIPPERVAPDGALDGDVPEPSPNETSSRHRPAAPGSGPVP